MPVISPKIIALDSSHLGWLAADAGCSETSRRCRAAEFRTKLDDCGGVLVLCWHHIEELLLHDDEAVVAERVAFLRSLPLVARVSSLVDDALPGSVVDITAREVAAAFKSPEADAADVQHSVAPRMFHLGPGSSVIAPFMANWRELQPLLRERQARNRDIVAIDASDFTGVSDTKASQWLNGKLRSPEEIERQLGILHDRLSEDMRHRGDKRIVDPASSAFGFLEGVRQTGFAALSATSNPVAQLLRALKVDVADIRPEMTMADLGDMARFRQRLEHFSEILGIAFDVLKARVRENQLPSHMIQSALRRHRQDTSEWKGSELNDRWLACLAAYADITFVDRRVLESLTQARRKDSTVANLLHRVEKASNYVQAANKLAG